MLKEEERERENLFDRKRTEGEGGEGREPFLFSSHFPERVDTHHRTTITDNKDDFPFCLTFFFESPNKEQ